MDNKTHTHEWFLSAMFLIFMTLKLAEVVTWSWFWVAAPIWMPISFVLTVYLGLISWHLVRDRVRSARSRKK